MDYQVVWSSEAVEDLESIANYIGRDSEFYAQAVVSKIVTTTRDLKDFPWIGRIVPELGEDIIRERFVYSYRVVYQVNESQILIVAVIHGKRLIDDVAERIGKTL